VGARRELLASAFAAGDWKAVAEHAAELARRDPSDARAPLAEGIAARHQGKAEEALAAYARAEELGSGKLAEVHLARGVTLAKLKRQCAAASRELRRYEQLAGPAGLDAAATTALERECADASKTLQPVSATERVEPPAEAR
jgi:hypothetical protein